LRNPSRNDGHSFNFEQAIVPEERLDSGQPACRRTLFVDEAIPDLAKRQEPILVKPDDLVIQLDDVLRASPCRRQHGLQIGECLRGLRPKIVFAHDLASLAQSDLAGEKDGLAAAHDGGMTVARRRRKICRGLRIGLVRSDSAFSERRLLAWAVADRSAASAQLISYDSPLCKSPLLLIGWADARETDE